MVLFGGSTFSVSSISPSAAVSNALVERHPEYSRERTAVVEMHSLQHRPQKCVVLDCMGIGQRRKEREHGGDPADRR